ncbi:MAG TPA: DUF488 domain-containing protein [Micropepsaceae bacterium]|jgi:uncharacterized protein (DUF488 family)
MIFTIGHSNQTRDRFLDLVGQNAITALADVRSVPLSRWASQFNRDALAKSLAERGIAYVFLGRELGGRPKDPAFLRDGRPDYAAMARSEGFRTGIARVREGAKIYRLALMCAERDPIDCHRFLLIARHLAGHGVPVSHILASGTVEEQQATERRFHRRDENPDLFGN